MHTPQSDRQTLNGLPNDSTGCPHFAPKHSPTSNK
jgi:hypothetical protein